MQNPIIIVIDYDDKVNKIPKKGVNVKLMSV